MKKSIDFSEGIRGKHSQVNLEIVGAVKSVWAVCISKREEYLIHFKVYKIQMSLNSEKVIAENEKGETKSYPKDWFAPLKISPNVTGLLNESFSKLQ